MNDNDRQIFWETLCSLEGKNIESDAEILKEKTKIPRYLYRYRSVNCNSLEALRFNKMYFSTANYYDDPFDTFINVDIKGFKSFFEKILNSEDSWQMGETMLRKFLSIMQISTADNEMSKIISDFKNIVPNKNFYNFCMNYLRNIRNEIKKMFGLCAFLKMDLMKLYGLNMLINIKDLS